MFPFLQRIQLLSIRWHHWPKMSVILSKSYAWVPSCGIYTFCCFSFTCWGKAWILHCTGCRTAVGCRGFLKWYRKIRCYRMAPYPPTSTTSSRDLSPIHTVELTQRNAYVSQRIVVNGTCTSFTLHTYTVIILKEKLAETLPNQDKNGYYWDIKLSYIHRICIHLVFGFLFAALPLSAIFISRNL